jgi:hypothetical protein
MVALSYMVTLSHYWFGLLIFLISIVDNMASQNHDNWEFSLVQFPDDLIQLSQPLTFRRRLQDEAKTSKRRI